MRHIELLSPARNLECGIEAVKHGADTVYIGAERFGARAAAGNSLDDIQQLVDFAHPFGVKIYVTVNTLLYDSELADADRLIGDLADIGVDALIVQDPRLMQLSRGRIALHASTQMDNRTASQVKSLFQQGYKQAVLARELSLEEIRDIHRQVPEMPLEVFVHGALCVSYSGRCYASEYCFQRSANRGECAQFCRLPFDLIDGKGQVLQRGKHLLSLHDMNRSADLEALLDAGASSLKIEGRLKDVGYVKNITAFYRQQLDRIISRHPDLYVRASSGQTELSFEPNPLKSFNRGFTDYFLHGRTADLASIHTPKSLGEPVGTVKDVRGNVITVAGTSRFENGDGLCYFDANNQLHGFRVNSIDQHGRLTVRHSSSVFSHSSFLTPGSALFRNQDQAFDRILSKPSANRQLSAKWLLEETPTGFRLTLSDETGNTLSNTFDYPHQEARSPQRDNIIRQLSRMGDTIYRVDGIDIRFSKEWFIPASVLGEWRRTITGLNTNPSPVGESRTGEGNLGECATGERPVEKSVERLMTCRYCIRYQLGQCPNKQNYRGVLNEPWSLRMDDGRTFPLKFNCRECKMYVLKENVFH
ncbi:MAG: U32 family peptidase [Bacteroidaceae bacterium]|nr:U32 family peptidase [Bacteroidaceae bacterium]